MNEITIAARLMWFSGLRGAKIKGRPFPSETWAELLKMATPQDLESLATEDGKVKLVDVIEDGEGRGCWHTAKRAWLSGIESGASHILVVNDDALLCKDFCKLLPELIRARPSSLISLFAMRQTVERFALPAFTQGKRWIDTNIWCNGLAMIMPRELARKAIEWIDANLYENEANDEIGFQLYMTLHGPPIAICNPSLVQHDPSMISTKSHCAPNREAQAYSFTPDLASSVDWSQADGVHWLNDVRPILFQSLWMIQKTSPVIREYRLD